MKKLLVFMLAASFCATCAAESDNCYEIRTGIDEYGREYQYCVKLPKWNDFSLKLEH